MICHRCGKQRLDGCTPPMPLCECPDGPRGHRRRMELSDGAYMDVNVSADVTAETLAALRSVGEAAARQLRDGDNELFGSGKGSRPSLPVAPDGPDEAPSASQGDGSGAARRLATGASGVEGRPVTESAGPRDLAYKLRNEDDTALRNYLASPSGLDEDGAA